MPTQIYLDNNATTQPLPEVVERMLPFLRERYANPSSVHRFGQRLRHEVDLARETVAALINARPKEIVFTSGGTESINLAIRGHLASYPEKKHVITSTVEHSAVRKVCDKLRENGYRVDEIAVDDQGRLDTAELENRITADTALVTMLHANNETGVLLDIPRVATLCKCHNVTLHVDAVQSAGKIPIDVADLPVKMLTLSAHKFHGPKGAGALYIRRRTRVEPLVVGGSQERNLRGGTENVPAIIGLAAAAECAIQRDPVGTDRVRDLRDRLETGILSDVPNAQVNGAAADRIHNTTNIAFPGLEAEAILILLSDAGIYASAGSACSSGSLEPSHVLKAMGIEPSVAKGAIRFSLSHNNTHEEIDHVVATVPKLLARLTRLAQ